MKKFKVVSSVGEGKEFFNNVDFELKFDSEEIGAECFCLGNKFTITQNGKIFVLVNSDWVLTIQDITPEELPEVPSLIVNKNIEVYLETKEIEVKVKCTYSELYNFLLLEWRNINEVSPIQFPLELRENGNLLLKDSWNIKGFDLISEGSFERQNSQLRSI